NWMPVGKSSLKSGRATEIVFMPTGLVRDPVADQIITTDTSFEICDASSDPKYSKMVTISKMGTIQQIVDGDCT
ncbi:MAG: type II secretion system protein GspH, partial [Acinetobacter sp.]